MTPLNRGLVESARASIRRRLRRGPSLQLQALARRIVSFWSDVDVVLTPTLALPPVPIGWQDEVDGPIEQLLRNTEFTPFTAVANLTGQPAMSLPLHWSDAGLPIGVQAIGPPAGDALLLEPRSADRSGAAVGGPAAARRADQPAIVMRIVLTRRRVQHARSAAARDRERHVLVAVLVEDHVARSCVRERPRHHRVVALARRARARRASRRRSPAPRRRRGRG